MTPLSIAARRSIERARKDPAAFVEVCGVADDGDRLTCTGWHAQLQSFWSKNSRTVCYAPVGSGKSVQLAWRLLWELGRRPATKIGFVSSTEGLGTDTASVLRSAIKSNPMVARVFPGLAMSTSQPLDTVDAFRIERPGNSATPSFKVYGANSTEINGVRLDLLVLDDVASWSNSLTPESRSKITNWIRSTALSRATSRGIRVICLNNPQHRDAAPEVLSRLEGWELMRAPAQDSEGRVLVPALMSANQLAAKRSDLGFAAAAMIDCETPRAGASMFKEESITGALKAGRGLTFVPRFNPADAATYSGVDLGGGVGRDHSAIFTFCVLADGARRVLDIRSGDWDGNEIVANIRDVHRSYGSLVAVESNATQGLIADLASDVPTTKIQTTQILKQHGLLGFAAELQTAWLFPSTMDGQPADEELSQFIRELLAYTPSSHTGDRLMAAVMAREVCRQSFDVLEQYDAAEQAADDLLENYGIYGDPAERRLNSGAVGFHDVNPHALRGW